MPDYVLLDGDKANFMPAFGAAIVVVRPGDLKGSGPATLNGKKLCIDGDEKNVSVPGCVYMTPQYSIPGTGTLKIAALAANQKAQKTKTGGKAVLLKGGTSRRSLKSKIPRNSRRRGRERRFRMPRRSTPETAPSSRPI